MGAARLTARTLGACAALAAAGGARLAAQGYRLQIDTRAQAASYRGVRLDSIAVGDTVTGPGGGPATPDGFAVSCDPGAPYCIYYRPGGPIHSAPVTATADLTVWGLGVTGLSVHALARAGSDLGNASAEWPGTSPAVQLLEGYAELARPRFTVRVGRQTEIAPLGVTGFDGGSLRLRAPRAGLELTGYLGWGLALASALPVTSPALNPLDDFQPVERQLVAGAGAGYSSPLVDVDVRYERQVDRRSQYFVSERARVDAVLHPATRWSLAAGATYDLAQAFWANAQATLTYSFPRNVVVASAGVRRYRPDFDLWSIWGVFSPTPYTAGDASVVVTPAARLRLTSTAELYRFDATGAEAPLAPPATTSGWRFGWDATWTPGTRWTLEGGYRADHGTGASSRGFDGAVTFAAAERLNVTVHAATLDRPLEFRYDDASVRMYGASVEFSPVSRWRFQGDVTRYVENRARPDAGAFDWNQVRVNARVVFTLGRGADLSPSGLPPAVDAMPEAPDSGKGAP